MRCPIAPDSELERTESGIVGARRNLFGRSSINAFDFQKHGAWNPRSRTPKQLGGATMNPVRGLLK
jgi:hypothetical protein